MKHPGVNFWIAAREPTTFSLQSAMASRSPRSQRKFLRFSRCFTQEPRRAGGQLG